MVSAYYNNPMVFIYTFICISVLALLLIILNIFLNKLLKKKSSLGTKKRLRRKETYELRVNSIRTIDTVNTSQTIILALLFLLFNLKITLLTPMILSWQMSSCNKQIFLIIYIVFIMFSVYIKVTSNVISFYKSKKTKYIL